MQGGVNNKKTKPGGNRVNKQLKKAMYGLIFIIFFGFIFALQGNLIAEKAHCTATLKCSAGATVSCTGYKRCVVYSNYVSCDNDVTAECM